MGVVAPSPSSYDLDLMARALGGDVRAGEVLCPGPGHSAKDRSLAVRPVNGAPEGYLVHSFAGDDPQACRDHVRAILKMGVGRNTAGRTKIDFIRSAGRDDVQDRISSSMRIWRETKSVRGTIGESYLASRGLCFDPLLGEAVRFHPRLLFDGRATPTIVSLLRDVVSNAPCGIHRTFLSSDGHKVARRMLGRAGVAAVKLDTDEEVTLALTIGEGVETCIAARQLGLGPVWAVGSAGAMGAFPVLSGIETIRLLAEHDASGANARAVAMAAERWLKAEREVLVFEPGTGDMNDALQECQQ